MAGADEMLGRMDTADLWVSDEVIMFPALPTPNATLAIINTGLHDLLLRMTIHNCPTVKVSVDGQTEGRYRMELPLGMASMVRLRLRHHALRPPYLPGGDEPFLLIECRRAKMARTAGSAGRGGIAVPMRFLWHVDWW